MPTEQPVVLAPSASYHEVPDEEFDVLRRIGEQWSRSPGGRRLSRAALPADPDLAARVRGSSATSRFERLVRVAEEGFVASSPGTVVATERAIRPPSPLGRIAYLVRRVVVGPPLATTALVQERLSRVVALAVLSSDALSSVAYGTEAMLSVLVLAGAAALPASLPIAAVIVVLMLTVGASYRQTIRAYPRGGGSYIVASDNLGRWVGLVAAAGLMTDYVLTVAVSVAAGVAAMTSALPVLGPDSVALGVAVIALILAANLRGIRQSGAIFAVPTYAFVAGILLLIAVGLGRAASTGWRVAPVPDLPVTETLGPLLLLRAFASGCSAMTGLEAIADGVPAFRPPEWRNARTTLTWMVGLLAVMFAGITVLARLDGAVPSPHETVLSQIAAHTFGRGPLYGYLQAATTLILVLAANTAFSDFPRLLYFLARDGYAPGLFLRLGDRLAYSNGILVLGVAAAGLLVAFQGVTDRLISLYAIGVFLAFTLSQSGMTVRWWRRREPGWARSLPVNACGAALSGCVLVIIAVSKFTEGAWVIVLLIPLVVLLLSRIRSHYVAVERATAPRPPSSERTSTSPSSVVDGALLPSEQAESPDEITHLIVVPVARLDLPALRALAYAASLTPPVLALHVATDDEDAQRIRSSWSAWGDHVPLEVIMSPYRVVAAPIVNYVRALHRPRPDLTITVVLPELVVTQWWQHPLHNQVSLRVRTMLRVHAGTVVTSVPYHLGAG
ncbi:MAG TPA: APC family permease [Candidatus Dormibacteraeota bacterium]|nr:APC family permease [Candidatus Dormibacteraeota bacterium]